MVTPIQFLMAFEAGSETIFGKKIYIDIAEDLNAGILLTQIVFWNKPSKDNQSGTKLKVEKEGRWWLARKRTDWMEELRLSPKQYDRAIKILEAKGLVEVRLRKFSATPTHHIWLNMDALGEAMQNMKYGPDGLPILPKGENGLSPKGKMDFDLSVKSLTETTTETTSIAGNSAAHPSTGKQNLKPTTGKEKQPLPEPKGVEEDMGNINDTLEKFKAAKAHDLANPDPATGVMKCIARWKKQAGAANIACKVIAKTTGQMKHVFKAKGEDTNRGIDWVFANWDKFANKVKQVEPVHKVPTQPTIEFFCTYYEIAWQLIAAADAKAEAQKNMPKVQSVIDKPAQVGETVAKESLATPEQVAASLALFPGIED